MADLTTTSTSSYPTFAQPYAAGYLQRAQQVTDTPYQAYQGPMVADLNQYQTGALDGIAQRAMQGSSVMSAANGALPSYFSGQGSATANPYAGSNPYLQQNIDAAQQDLARNWNNVAAPSWATANQQSGSFGNAGLALAENNARSDLQRNMGQIGSTMRMQDYTQQQQLGESYASRNDAAYNNAQSRGLQALNMAPTFAQQDYTDLNAMLTAGNQYQAQNQQQATAGYQQYLDARNYPTQQLDYFGNALRSAVGNQGTQTQTSPGVSTGASVLGGALTGASIFDMLFKAKP